MPLRVHLDEDPRLGMTPFVDIIFNLLVFFLVAGRLTGTEQEERELDLDLPEVGAAQPLTGAPLQDITIRITRDGTTYWNTEAVDNVQLQSKLDEAANLNRDQTIKIEGDRGCLFQWIAETVSLCKTAGLDRVSFSVVQSEE